MTTTDLIGYAAGLLLALCFLPQVVKTVRVRHADDVSMGMLLLTLGSAILYEIYAWRLSLMPVVVMNGVFGVLVLLEIVLKAHFDRVRRGAGE
jgi:MtN3 and saliva related transmembrane protein